MQKIISINLNGNAYQLDESGYEALREYLDRAQRELEGNPDRSEIMADLEQAIADKCQRFLGPHKSVVAAAEVQQIVNEMGPVATAPGGEAHGAAGAGSAHGRKADAPPPPRRLYRITDGAMIAGVCTGLAAYLNVDVVFIRVAFVVAALLTKGVAIFGYLVMMFVVPEAATPEERAAAGGVPFSAKDVVDRAREHYAKGRQTWNREWRRQRAQWRQQRREWRRAGWGAPAAAWATDVPPPWAFVLPLFGLIHIALFMIAVAAMISVVNHGAILDWTLPPDVPMWAAVLALFVIYQIVVSPFRAAQHWAWRPGVGAAGGLFAFWYAAIWLAGIAVVVWIASNNVGEIRDFLQHLPQLFRDFVLAMRDLFDRNPRP